MLWKLQERPTREADLTPQKHKHTINQQPFVYRIFSVVFFECFGSCGSGQLEKRPFLTHKHKTHKHTINSRLSTAYSLLCFLFRRRRRKFTCDLATRRNRARATASHDTSSSARKLERAKERTQSKACGMNAFTRCVMNMQI